MSTNTRSILQKNLLEENKKEIESLKIAWLGFERKVQELAWQI